MRRIPGNEVSQGYQLIPMKKALYILLGCSSDSTQKRGKDFSVLSLAAGR